MSEQREGGLGYVLWTTDDFPDYSKLSGAQQHEVLEALAAVRAEADERSGIPRPPDGIEKRSSVLSPISRNMFLPSRTRSTRPTNAAAETCRGYGCASG